MVEPPTIPVSESKLLKLERDHDFLEAIRAKNVEVGSLRDEYAAKKDECLAAKKAYDVAATELQQLIENGPPKPDAQKRLPFAEDRTDEVSEPPASRSEQPTSNEPAAEAAAEPEQPEAKVEIPAEIEALEITDQQKQRLAEAGCKTLADVVDLGNKNWPNYPEGFKSLANVGPRAAAKMMAALPSTAPPAPQQEEAKTIRIKLLTFSGASPNLEPGKEYDATELPNGHVIVQLPGDEPVTFLPHEYEKVELATVS